MLHFFSFYKYSLGSLGICLVKTLATSPKRFPLFDGDQFGVFTGK